MNHMQSAIVITVLISLAACNKRGMKAQAVEGEGSNILIENKLHDQNENLFRLGDNPVYLSFEKNSVMNLASGPKECSASRIQLVQENDGQTLGSWSEADWTSDSRGQINLNQPLPAETTSRIANKDLRFEIQRCCSLDPANRCLEPDVMNIYVKLVN